MTREELEKMFTYHMAHAAIEFHDKYTNKSVDSSDVLEGFEAGAEWAQKFIIKRACEWWEEQNKKCMFELEMILGGNFIKDFKKAMEE